MSQLSIAEANNTSTIECATTIPRLIKAFKSVGRASEIWEARAATPDWIKLTSAYLGLPVRMPFSIRLKTGPFAFQTLADLRTFWSVFFAGTYGVRPEDTLIVDAGANIGTFTLFSLLKAPHSRVIAIEPAADCCSRLREMIAEHGFAGRCEIYQAALGETFGTSTIDLHCGSQFREVGKGGTTVSLIPLDHAVGNLPIDLLKMDIEGGEYPVLESSPACLERVDRIALEYHPNKAPKGLIRSLDALGLSCTLLRDDGAGYGIAHFARSAGHTA